MFSSPTLAQKAERPDVKVGDQWRFTMTATARSPAQELSWVVTSVGPAEIRATENGKPLLLTPDMNERDSPRRADSDRKLLNFPLEVGKSWTFENEFSLKDTGAKGRSKSSVTVLNREKLRIPAGEFDAFKLEMVGDAKGKTAEGHDYVASGVITFWYAPAARTIVRQDVRDSVRGPYKVELVALNLRP